MKNILVPVDFKKASLDAIKTAVEICNYTKSNLVAIHMLESDEFLISKPSQKSYEEYLFLINEAKAKFKKISEDLELNESLTFTYIIKKKKDLENLDAITFENKIDLIVMGTEGIGYWKSLIESSNSQKTVRHSSTPILTIKEKTNIKEKKIVYASDFKEESIEGFHKLLPIFESLNLKISPLYVVTQESFKYSDDIYENFKIFLELTKNPLKLSLNDLNIENAFSIEEGVTSFSKRKELSITGICTHGHTGFKHYFNGSIAENLVNDYNNPVLSVKM